MAVARIAAVRGYRGYFEAAFGDSKVTIGRIAAALAHFERTVVTGHSSYDRYVAGDNAALSEGAVRGMALFKGKANCASCHMGPDFTDDSFYNLGVGMQRRQLDLGRYNITKRDEDHGAFKTPTLRNLADTFPYMHDGSQATLDETIEFFDRGGQGNQWLSKKIKPLGLSAEEKRDLLAFLSALNGDKPVVEPPKTFPQ